MQDHKVVKISIYTEEGKYTKNYSVYEPIALSVGCETLKDLVKQTLGEISCEDVTRIRVSSSMEYPHE